MASAANDAGSNERRSYRTDANLSRLQDSFRFRIGSAATQTSEGRTQRFRLSSRNGDGPEEPRLHVRGWACTVHKLKPGRLGGAIVEFNSAQVREDVMSSVQRSSADDLPQITIKGVRVSLRRHVEERHSPHSREVAESIFISW
eukprot:TRINITY_DN19976_c0_g2_i2.p1 TRINITY_DN19976_c0_g2~~TRINITY_DN19976_c0_g2_i2.p1  ORF type:complete len:144 (-),score=15.43 TRINITY_DN19976_c0_g2_i2:263-694(-)